MENNIITFWEMFKSCIFVPLWFFALGGLNLWIASEKEDEQLIQRYTKLGNVYIILAAIWVVSNITLWISKS